MTRLAPTDLERILSKLTPAQQERFWRDNPQVAHLRPDGPPLPPLVAAVVGIPLKPRRRLRQSQKPLLNKLETDFLAYHTAVHPDIKLRPQAKRYELARGIWYKPDFTTIVNGTEWAFEVKGPKVFRGGFENLKVAARAWPDVWWILVWKEDRYSRTWSEQRVLP
jgi:hypothetical protein